MKNIIGLMIIPFVMVGCATIDEKKATKESIYANYIKEKKLESQKKITSFRFQGWRSLDNHYLILSKSLNKPYLINLMGYCSDLRFTQTIAVHNSSSTLLAKFDSISVPSNIPIKCRINAIYKITKEQADELSALKREKTKES